MTNLMVTLAALIVSEDDLIALAQHYNRDCLHAEWCLKLRGPYLTEAVLRPVAREVIAQSAGLGVHPLWMMAYIQEESGFVSDAVSRFNKVKPHPTDPWNKPPTGRKNWCGLDFGISQIHVPSKWAPQCSKEQISKLRDPVRSVQILAEYMRYRMQYCRRQSTQMCREMLKLTGVALHRKLLAIPLFVRVGIEFLTTRRNS